MQLEDSTTPKALSVSELSSRLKALIESQFYTVWVCGEVSNIRFQSSGHIYFTLKDNHSQISAVMFRGDASRLDFRLQDGMEVLVFGNLSVYEPRGAYQIIVRQCLESGAGRLQAQFEALKKKLMEEGLFEPERKKNLPFMPSCIAVLTSPSGAALRDFISILRRRHWVGKVIVIPALVQGKDAPSDICEKLSWVEFAPEAQLLVVCRGGGSIEDLWCFNDENVVRALAACPLPTISAIGHETDFVLSDFASDQRAETPSAAAELISSQWVDGISRFARAGNALTRFAQNTLNSEKTRVQHLADRLRFLSPKRVLEHQSMRLDEVDERLRFHLIHQKSSASNKLMATAQRLQLIQPLRHIQSATTTVNRLETQLLRACSFNRQGLASKLSALEKRLTALSVETVLKRGFAIVRDQEGTIKTNVSDIDTGMEITTQFHNGSIRSRVVSHDAKPLVPTQ